MEDNQIILLFNQRKEEAITETAEKYSDVCRKTAGRILEAGQDIEECVNDALMHAWNSIPPQKPLNLAAFLVTITRNIALDRHKYNARHKRGKGQINLVLDELSDCIQSSEDIEDADKYNGHDTTLEGVAKLKERLESHGADLTYKLYDSHHYQFIPEMLCEVLMKYYPA